MNLILALILIAITAPSLWGETLTGCLKNSGAVGQFDFGDTPLRTCKSRETQVSIPLANGATAPDLAVVDDNENAIGPVVGFARGPNLIPIVALRVNAHIFALRVYSDRFGGDGRVGVFDNEPDYLLFESGDCLVSGTPFIYTQGLPSSPMPLVVVTVPGDTVWLQDPNGVDQVLDVRSYLQRDGTCIVGDLNGRCGGAGQCTGVPAIPVTDLNQQFTAPFSVQ